MPWVKEMPECKPAPWKGNVFIFNNMLPFQGANLSCAFPTHGVAMGWIKSRFQRSFTIKYGRFTKRKNNILPETFQNQ